ANRKLPVVGGAPGGGGPAPLAGVNPYYPTGDSRGGGAGGAAAGPNLDAMNAQQVQQYAKGQLTPAQRYQLARWYIQRQAAGRSRPAPSGAPNSPTQSAVAGP